MVFFFMTYKKWSSCKWSKKPATGPNLLRQYEFHSTMARKKQTTSKSRRKEKGVPKLRAECSVCKWTTRLTTLENARGEVVFLQLQFHGFAPVRQVEDSEEKVAEDTSNQEVITTVLDLAKDHQMDSVSIASLWVRIAYLVRMRTVLLE